MITENAATLDKTLNRFSFSFTNTFLLSMCVMIKKKKTKLLYDGGSI